MQFVKVFLPYELKRSEVIFLFKNRELSHREPITTYTKGFYETELLTN